MCQGCWSTSQTRPQKIHRSKSFCHYERKVKFWLGQFSGKGRSWGPGGMGLPTRSSPEQMPRPYEVGKVQFIPVQCILPAEKNREVLPLGSKYTILFLKNITIFLTLPPPNKIILKKCQKISNWFIMYIYGTFVLLLYIWKNI